VHDETDETIVRIAAALRPLPDVDPAEKARVLVAVAAERERSRVAGIRAARRWRRMGALGALAAAGLVAAVWLRGRDAITPSTTATSGTSATTTVVGSAAPAGGVGARLTRDAEGMTVKPVQLVLRAPAARSVSVVGDFNGWDARANTMTRDPASGLWSHTVALRPGRHVYAFVVDDSVWMRDPRSPEAMDEDFGRPGSVLFVGQP
jgi:Carbohydrate-binding module 48 (Isoamylase N-terminal domain)